MTPEESKDSFDIGTFQSQCKVSLRINHDACIIARNVLLWNR